MANQYPQVLKVFEHLKKTTGGIPAELKPNEGEKFRFGWRTKDTLYELFQLGDCLYFCGATEKHSGEDEKKILELLNWLNGWSHYGTFTLCYRPKTVSLEQTHFAYSDYKFEELFSFLDQFMKRMTLYYLSSDMVFEENIPFEDAVDKASLQMKRKV